MTVVVSPPLWTKVLLVTSVTHSDPDLPEHVDFGLSEGGTSFALTVHETKGQSLAIRPPHEIHLHLVIMDIPLEPRVSLPQIGENMCLSNMNSSTTAWI